MKYMCKRSHHSNSWLIQNLVTFLISKWNFLEKRQKCANYSLKIADCIRLFNQRKNLEIKNFDEEKKKQTNLTIELKLLDLFRSVIFNFAKLAPLHSKRWLIAIVDKICDFKVCLSNCEFA